MNCYTFMACLLSWIVRILFPLAFYISFTDIAGIHYCVLSALYKHQVLMNKSEEESLTSLSFLLEVIHVPEFKVFCVPTRLSLLIIYTIKEPHTEHYSTTGNSHSPSQWMIELPHAFAKNFGSQQTSKYTALLQLHTQASCCKR